MENITAVVAFVAEILAVLAILVPYFRKTRKQIDKLTEGTKCQLRSEMLRIYYHNREKKTIRQYEYENFVMLYEAYKALKGNSFIDKIYAEVKEWEVIT